MATNAEGSNEFVLIMNGTDQPERNEFLVLGLQSGERYRFKLQALNFNGASPLSSEFTFNACLAPSSLHAPYRLASTTSSITVGWTEALDDGGCPVTGYALFRDLADESAPSVEVNSASEAALRSVPTARELVVTNFAASSEGKFVRFSVRAYNREGHVDSGTYVSILYAAIPSKPSSTPQHVAAESNSTIIALTLPELAPAETGNTDILAYSLEMDNGQAGDFFQVASESMIVEYNVTVERGLTYRFRYRARNSVGWGPYSDAIEVLAA